MKCRTIAKLDKQGRVNIPLDYRRKYGLKGGEMLNIVVSRIKLVNVDSIEELERENVPGAATPVSGHEYATKRNTKEVSQ